MHSCSVVALINYHQCGSLRQHKFILSQFWRSEAQAQRGLMGQNQGVARTVFLPEGSGMNLCPSPSRLLAELSSLWLWGLNWGSLSASLYHLHYSASCPLPPIFKPARAGHALLILQVSDSSFSHITSAKNTLCL